MRVKGDPRLSRPKSPRSGLITTRIDVELDTGRNEMFTRPGQRYLRPHVGCDKRSAGARVTWVQHREGVWVFGPTSAQNRIIYNALRGGRGRFTGGGPGRGLLHGLRKGRGASLAPFRTLERFVLLLGRVWLFWLGWRLCNARHGFHLKSP